MTEEELLAWFAEHGYYSYKEMPPEEEPCSECEGDQIVYRWIPAAELFEKVFPIISQHWKEEAVTA